MVKFSAESYRGNAQRIDDGRHALKSAPKTCFSSHQICRMHICLTRTTNIKMETEPLITCLRRRAKNVMWAVYCTHKTSGVWMSCYCVHEFCQLLTYIAFVYARTHTHDSQLDRTIWLRFWHEEWTFWNKCLRFTFIVRHRIKAHQLLSLLKCVHVCSTRIIWHINFQLIDKDRMFVCETGNQVSMQKMSEIQANRHGRHVKRKIVWPTTLIAFPQEKCVIVIMCVAPNGVCANARKCQQHSRTYAVLSAH